MKFEDLPRWAQMLIVVVAIVAGAVTFHIMYLSKQAKEIEVKGTTLTKLQEENNKTAIVERQLPEFEADVKRLSDQLEQLVQVFPTTLETDILINKIKGLADNYNLRIASITPKPLAAKGIYSEFVVEFKVSGTYHSLAMFFAKVLDVERVVSIGNLKLSRISKGKGATGIHTIDASYSAVTYIYKG